MSVTLIAGLTSFSIAGAIVGVVAAIAVRAAWVMRTFSWMSNTDPLMPASMLNRWQEWWLLIRRGVAQSLSVSVAAAVGSTPLTMFHFGLMTPVSVIAGLILLPLVFAVLSLALLSVAISMVAPPVSESLNRLNGLAATASVRSAELFSEIPGGHFRMRRESGPFLLAYDLGSAIGPDLRDRLRPFARRSPQRHAAPDRMLERPVVSIGRVKPGRIS